MISLYFHFPFCARKCNYCAFYSKVGCTEAQKDAYLQALLQHMRAYPEGLEVKTVYFGGGTPSLLGKERLLTLIDAIKTRFSLVTNCEWTIEVNPKTVTSDLLNALHEAGVNRLSVGMQSADDAELSFLGRTHTFAETCACVREAREAGFDNISLDLLFALPGQTVERFADTLEQALALQPEHFSVYSLQLEENTAFFRKRETLSFPDEETEETQYALLCDRMREAGYTHYEISSFAKLGRESEHNMVYWRRGEYIGFGPAAHSFLGGRRFSNRPDLQAYLDDPLGANDYAAQERISEEEAAEEEILLGLRMASGISETLVSPVRLERMLSLGLMQRTENGNVRLTETGWRVSNAVIGQLLV